MGIQDGQTQNDGELSNVELFNQIEAEQGDDGRRDEWLDGEAEDDAEPAPATPSKADRKAKRQAAAPKTEGTDDVQQDEGHEGDETTETEAQAEGDPGDEAVDDTDPELTEAHAFAKGRGLKLVDAGEHEKRVQIAIRKARRELRAGLEQEHAQRVQQLTQREQAVNGSLEALKLLDDGDIDGAVDAWTGGRYSLQDLNKAGVQQLQGMTPRQRKELEQARRENKRLEEVKQQREKQAQQQAIAQRRAAYVQTVSGQLREAKNPTHKAMADKFASLVVAKQEQMWDPNDPLPLDEAADLVLEELRGYHTELSNLFGPRGPSAPAENPEKAGKPATRPDGSKSAKPAPKRARQIRQSDTAEASPQRKHFSDAELKRMALEEFDAANG